MPFNNVLHFSLKRSKNFIGSSAMYLIYFMLLKIYSWSTIPLYHWKVSSFTSFIASNLFVWYYYSYTRLLWVNAISFYFYFLALVYLRWFSYKQHVIRFYFFIQSNNILLLVFSLLSYMFIVPTILLFMSSLPTCFVSIFVFFRFLFLVFDFFFINLFFSLIYKQSSGFSFFPNVFLVNLEITKSTLACCMK